MNRDCNKCVYSTREGGCRKWTCEGTKTVEDIRAETIEELVLAIDQNLSYDICDGREAMDEIVLIVEKLKEHKDE